MTVYLYVILQRLTDEELQKVKTKYHTHIIDMQSQSQPNVQKNNKKVLILFSSKTTPFLGDDVS